VRSAVNTLPKALLPAFDLLSAAQEQPPHSEILFGEPPRARVFIANPLRHLCAQPQAVEYSRNPVYRVLGSQGPFVRYIILPA
jgi:hypothetical protein